MPVPGLGVVQLAVAVGAADDPLEVEAERVAADVVAVLRRRAGESPRAAHEQHGMPGTDCCGVRRTMRRQPAPGADIGLTGGLLSTEQESVLRSRRGSGRALPGVLRAPLEDALSADLSAVRLHEGPEASRLNRSMSALAFTHGQDIYFRDGVPNAASDAGLHLLAHELTHTVQQGSAPVRRRPVIRRAIKVAKAQAALANLLAEHESDWYATGWKSGEVKRITQEIADQDDTTEANVKSRLTSHPTISPLLRDYRMRHDQEAPDSAVDEHATVRIGSLEGDALVTALRLVWSTYKSLLFYHVSGAPEKLRSTGLDPLWGGSSEGLANTQSVGDKHEHNVKNSKNRVFVTRKWSEVKQYMGDGKQTLRIIIPLEAQRALRVDPDSQFGMYLEETAPLKPTVLLKGMDRLNARLGPEAWYFFTLAIKDSTAGVPFGEEIFDYLPELYGHLFTRGFFGEGKPEPVLDLTTLN